jgi:ribonucleoside-diphosphate reductase alpha chain
MGFSEQRRKSVRFARQASCALISGGRRVENDALRRCSIGQKHHGHATARDAAPGQAARAKPDLKLVKQVQTDPSRDALLTDFGKKTLVDRYLLPGESYQDMFARVSTAYADDIEHAQRLYDYMSNLWFMPATPVLSNGGAERGLPIPAS